MKKTARRPMPRKPEDTLPIDDRSFALIRETAIDGDRVTRERNDAAQAAENLKNHPQLF